MSANSVDEYISHFPADIQVILEQVRKTIREAAPGSQETIKYQMPTITLNGDLMSFAAWKKHIAIYPAPAGDEVFNQELAKYRTEKSTVRFPLDQPIPYELIRQIVKYRLADHLRRAEARKSRKAAH